MLRGLRKASSNWLGKLVMVAVVGFLVISFAIWGIGDIFRGFGRSTVAKIGGTEIGVDQFRQLYNDRMQQVARQVGRAMSPEQIRALGIDRQVIGQLFAEVALDERVRALKLGISDAEIARQITADPNFQAPNGQFDRARFEALIRQAGFTEQRYIADMRQRTLRRQLVETISGGNIVPKAAVEAAERYRNEQRSVEYVLLDRAQAGDIPQPTPEDLAKYFEERKILFRAPEFRKIVIVSLIPGEQARWMEISDDDLKKAYEERKARYTTPERRTIQQIVFPNEDDAKAAAERIAKGETFEAIAKERNLTDKDIDLGTLTKAGIIDKAVGEAAFMLKEGESSAPVKGRFGVVIVHVSKVEPAKVPTFEEVAGDLKKDLATERAKSEMLTIYDKIEDERSIGTPLAEAAEKLKLAARTVDVDRSGRDPSGTPVANIPDAQRLLNTAFTTEPGVENDPLQVEGGYVWFDVTGTTPSRDRSLDEVKSQVETQWRDDEVATRLKAKATEMLDKVKAGTPLDEVAAAAGLKVETKAEIKRGGAVAPLSASAIDAIFRTAKDVAGSADAEQPGEQIVFRVTDIVEPTVDLASAQTKEVQDALTRAMSDDIFSAYVSQIENEMGVTINQNALRQVITGQTVPDTDE